MTEERVLGVDYGEKRVGLSLSDPLGFTAQPLVSLTRKNDGQIASELENIAREREVKRLVVGLPLKLSGADSARTRRTRRFIEHLRRRLKMPVENWDERLSTTEAERALRDTALSGQRRKAIRDVTAAQLILQGYLDRRRIESPKPV